MGGWLAGFSAGGLPPAGAQARASAFLAHKRPNSLSIAQWYFNRIVAMLDRNVSPVVDASLL